MSISTAKAKLYKTAWIIASHRAACVWAVLRSKQMNGKQVAA